MFRLKHVMFRLKHVMFRLDTDTNTNTVGAAAGVHPFLHNLRAPVPSYDHRG